MYPKSKRIHRKRLVVDNRSAGINVANPIVATGTDGLALGESYTKLLLYVLYSATDARELLEQIDTPI